MFNIVDTQTGRKADPIIRKDRPFSVREFARREPANISGVETFVVSVEDTILAKRDWSRESESARQFEDVVGVLGARSIPIDSDYLAPGAAELGVEAALARAEATARPS